MGEPSDKRPTIDAEECTGCAICIDVCENGVLDMEDDVAIVANPDSCTGCGDCSEECPVEAIIME
ncbi:MAG: 4Fe-4S binding protein [Actinomycetota bacterium]|nr:4Fe-4S binding protein [Actinomycetota bacterium]